VNLTHKHLRNFRYHKPNLQNHHEPLATPLPALPEEQPLDMLPAPVDPTAEIPGQSRCSGRISTQSSISDKMQLGHRVQHATSEIQDEDPTTYRKAVNGSLKGEWTSAMNDEIIAQKKNRTLGLSINQ